MPLALLQLSVVQGLLSSQTSAAPAAQLPPLQASPLVHGLPSLQLPLVLVWLQLPVVVSQLSVVQGLPSSQLLAEPAEQTPATQLSLLVQASPSLQSPLAAGFKQPPVPGSQASAVHGLPSKQALALPATQVPPLQLSPLVHRLPSSQAPSAGAVVQVPVAESQLSVVQGLLSSQLLPAPATQTAPRQASPSVQTSPSASHGVVVA